MGPWRALLVAGIAVAGCGEKAADKRDPVTEASAALDAGLPRQALAALEGVGDTAPVVLALRLVAWSELSEWGRVEGKLGGLSGPEGQAVRCVFGAARRDVLADKVCRERPPVDNAALEDAAVRARAKVAEDEHRLDEAEKRLRELVAKRPVIANRKAFVGYLERSGFVAEAVIEVEAWWKQSPEDGSLEPKLIGLLERKVRGDLLERRADAAESAARRILEIDPARGEVRYFLADALELKGDKDGAERERAQAKAKGFEAPPAPNTFPGFEGVPGGPGVAPPGVPGGHAHDHGHDHDH